MNDRAKTILALSIFPQIIVVKILAQYPQFIEDYYSNGLYLFLSQCMRFIFGWIPFSMGDIFYTAAGVLAIRHVIVNRKKIIKKPLLFGRDILMLISILYFTFHLCWGLNYYRQPLYKTLNIKNDYTLSELEAFTERLIKKTNQEHLKLASNKLDKVTIPYSKNYIYKLTPIGFDSISKTFATLNYNYSSIKTSSYSISLTYMGYSGYLNPFTNEAHVNGLPLDFKFPMVSCHEVAHQLGYSAENEANFIGFLAAKNNPDPYFKYAAYAYILRYCLGEVKQRDNVMFEKLNSEINPGIIKNYIEVSEFWKRYRNAAEPAFKKTYNLFLKANQQKDGLKSYHYVVSLLVNYFKDTPL